ncbi:MAG TPA: alanine--tRNA ligase [Candidatus Nanoarchaeia archaeon]|nr:alanine--tRNA ligase [Candidatus Nanoarchaeia archaeon]
MLRDKEIKKEFKAKASRNPEKYYAVEVLKQEGFERKQCKCGTFFWTASGSDVCGDPACSGGFRFIDGSPAKNELDYIEVWEEFSRLFKKWGYTPIPRYPVVARWRDDTDFVQASIYDFQPYVVSGEIKPPANPLVVPQFCLRFNDIDNVGITGAHYTGFVMIGQHAFVPHREWDQPKYFRDIHNWLKEGLGLPNDEITFHEDAWAGGGNFGPCMEFFSRGLELGNQVYMLYEVTASGNKELPLRVLDMGMGHERNAWFTKAASTSYETTFPTVCQKLKHITGIKVDDKLMRKFLPYSSYLNIDEVEDVGKAWKDVAGKVGVDVKELKDSILPLSAVYSIGEHSRALLVALSDGALPSNVGGGYNLRVILRRALGFIDQYGWKLDLREICELHAKYLKALYPEIMENLDEVNEILEVERKKYEQTKEKSHSIISKLMQTEIDEGKLLQLYDSQGITPELIRQEAAKLGKEVKIPENFYAKVSELHEKGVQKHATITGHQLDLKGVPNTKGLYFDDYNKLKFTGKVMKVIGKYVVLDQTAFYPTSGGQIHDSGTLAGERMVNVFKQGGVIVHELESEHEFPVGEEVEGVIDGERRKQLAQHHTATHIVNAAARKVLGNHVNQAGAKKDLDKATLDITHFNNLTEEESERVEEEANRTIYENIPIKLSFMHREEAEKNFGMRIYQGGAVPGKELRIVDIYGVDVECCGGTHLNNTGEAGRIRILKSNKVSDSIVRITFTAGAASEKEVRVEESILSDAAELLGVSPEQVPARAEELFLKWKMAKKALSKGNEITLDELELIAEEAFEGDALVETAEVLKTQPEHVPRTIKRFLSELEEMKANIFKSQ